LEVLLWQWTMRWNKIHFGRKNKIHFGRNHMVPSLAVAVSCCFYPVFVLHNYFIKIVEIAISMKNVKYKLWTKRIPLHYIYAILHKKHNNVLSVIVKIVKRWWNLRRRRLSKWYVFCKKSVRPTDRILCWRHKSMSMRLTMYANSLWRYTLNKNNTVYWHWRHNYNAYTS